MLDAEPESLDDQYHTILLLSDSTNAIHRSGTTRLFPSVLLYSHFILVTSLTGVY